MALRYVASPKELHGADVIILPGSKTTMTDLDYLRTSRDSTWQLFGKQMLQGAKRD